MTSACIETSFARSNGYGVKRVNGILRKHHRLVYADHNGVSIESIDGMEVMHLCDNPACVNPQHLKLGTHTENMHDMFSRGRRKTAMGEKTGRAKLSDDDARHIFSLVASGLPQPEIARMFGIDRSQVSRIKTKKTWRHL